MATCGFPMSAGVESKSVGPGASLSSRYLATRWITLREPLGFPEQSAELVDDAEACHAWIEQRGEILSVGRIHLIPADSAGACEDTVADDAANCPDFEPLKGVAWRDSRGILIPTPAQCRPASQIRQMGTLGEHRSKGYGRMVLHNLELLAVETWGVKTGWLQARIAAIGFYEREGWTTFSHQYDVEGIGPHVSMWKDLCEE